MILIDIQACIHIFPDIYFDNVLIVDDLAGGGCEAGGILSRAGRQYGHRMSLRHTDSLEESLTQIHTDSEDDE